MSFSDVYRTWLLAPVTAQLNLIQQELTKIMDILDTIVADMATISSDLAALATSQATLITDANTLITDFSTAPAGTISVSDPRFASLVSVMQAAATNAMQLSTSASALDTSIKAVLPAAPAPVTPPPAGA